MKYEVVYSDGSVKQVSFEEIIKKNDKNLVFFYPRDNTPGCTLENKDFSCLQKEYLDMWIHLIGVSKDSTESHKKFINDHALTFPLISDPELTLHKKFEAYGEKNNYGKIIQWVIRSTFLLDNNWNILQQWKNVRAKWHAQKVLREIEK